MLYITARQKEVLAAWAEPAGTWVNGIPYMIHRQLNAGTEHHQAMMLHGLRLVLYRLERKGLITWEDHPNGGRYIGHGVTVTDKGHEALRQRVGAP